MNAMELEIHRKCNEAEEYLVLVKQAFLNAEASIAQYQRAIGGFQRVCELYREYTGKAFVAVRA
ncbi:hypothetical protein [Lysinibacter sp. HNR]|uniref:hypothetical protein n=1 Tax=Lysinibacter sp. HNR TaxID=3031408 RepID=UPI00243521BE|nr:hypothetical protein [Lysinibacter sp. HNR]WGD36502.1 hypothetical protein FrondiHNR_08435 [Lysinibacter sp. HNR]